jgi:predicted deacylase
MRTESQDLFPKNYETARADFLREAAVIRNRAPEADLQSFQVPSAMDQDLFVDDLFVPASGSATSLLVLTSGVHGLEASLGSAVQIQFMREFLSPLIAKGTAVWIVHCLNPYGFKHGRRTTEANINLNRNFGTAPETFRTPNEGYKKLSSHFEKNKRARGGPLHKFATLSFLLKRLFTKEFDAQSLSQAISQGQFTNPRGLEYGGSEPTPQADYFRRRFETIAHPFAEIVLIDLHTGLGLEKRLHLLTGFDVAKCVHPETFQRLFRPYEESELYEFNSGDEKGFYQTIGDINTMVAELAPEKRVVALTFEFGTLGNGLLSKADSLSRLWLENQGAHYGFATKAHERSIRQKFKDLFEPQDPAWQQNALRITRDIFTRLVQRM